jgi:hypothetical protein
MLRGVMTGAVMCLTTLLAGASALGAAVTLKPGLEKDRQTQYDYTQTIEVEQIATVPDG